jgi:hypothetical protein
MLIVIIVQFFCGFSVERVYASKILVEQKYAHHLQMFNKHIAIRDYEIALYHVNQMSIVVSAHPVIHRLTTTQLSLFTNDLLLLKQSLSKVNTSATNVTLALKRFRFTHDAVFQQNPAIFREQIIHIQQTLKQASKQSIELWNIIRPAFYIRENEDIANEIDSLFKAWEHNADVNQQKNQIMKRLIEHFDLLSRDNQHTFLHSIQDQPQSIPTILLLCAFVVIALIYKAMKMFHAERLH